MSETRTADWYGSEPETGTMTSRRRSGAVWARRKVRPDGTVKFLGRVFRPAADVQTLPVPGEWLLLFNYGPEHDRERGVPTCGEWTAPADPDGYIRRYYWEPLAARLQEAHPDREPER